VFNVNRTANEASQILKVVDMVLQYKMYLEQILLTVSSVVATTHRNGTCSMLTSAKLTEGYLVVGLQENLTRSSHCIVTLFI